jgi:tyrosyl-tRNA synthetase
MAFDILKSIHTESSVQKTKKEFFAKMNGKNEEVSISLTKEPNVIDFLKATESTRSNREAKRLIKQRAVRVNGSAITDHTRLLNDCDKVEFRDKLFLVRINES